MTDVRDNRRGILAMAIAIARFNLSDALTKLMGRDPATPAGTPGVIVSGSANVLIGGFPLPGGSAVVRGLLRLLP